MTTVGLAVGLKVSAAGFFAGQVSGLRVEFSLSFLLASFLASREATALGVWESKIFAFAFAATCCLDASLFAKKLGPLDWCELGERSVF